MGRVPGRWQWQRAADEDGAVERFGVGRRWAIVASGAGGKSAESASLIGVEVVGRGSLPDFASRYQFFEG